MTSPIIDPASMPMVGGALIGGAQRAMPQNVPAVPKSELNTYLLNTAAVLDEARANVIREIGKLQSVRGVVEFSVKALEGASGVDRSVIAGSDDLAVLDAAVKTITDIAQRLGTSSGALLGVHNRETSQS